MNRSLILSTAAVVFGLGLGGNAFALDSTGGSGNAGNDSGNSALASYNNLTATLTDNRDQSSTTDINKTLTSTANIAKDNVTTSVGGDFTISLPYASTDQELKGVVVGNTFNLTPQQAAAAAAASGGSAGDGGTGLGLGGLGGPGGAAGNAAASSSASSGAQPISTGAISIDGAAMQNFAGIQTASFNTGIGSNALAATAVTANANVTFGSSKTGAN